MFTMPMFAEHAYKTRGHIKTVNKTKIDSTTYCTHKLYFFTINFTAYEAHKNQDIYFLFKSCHNDHNHLVSKA